MPLENFGSILNFAEELEKQDQEFYEALSGNPSCSDHKQMFEQFAATAKKNVYIAQRTRRENVTEMILEPIKGFVRAPYCEVCQAAPDMTLEDVLATAKKLEDRAIRYYTEAALKLSALPEVARALKLIGKKHQAHHDSLAAV